MKTIRDIAVKNKIVLVRVDYNVPVKDGKIESDLRVRASLPTLNYLREKGAKKIIILSHLGRPEGRDRNLSLAPVAKILNDLVGKVNFIDDVSGPDVETAVSKMKTGDILLLENLRFFSGETKNSRDFIREIIDTVNADFYIQDAFSVSHRAHASVDAVADYLPVYAGLLLNKEVENLDKILNYPKKPFLAIIGGAKVEDKSALIAELSKIATIVAVGGKIAADGFKPESDNVYVADDFDENNEGEKLDIGPVSTAKIAEYINAANTILWNGLLGKAEDPAYATSSTIVAKLLGEAEGKTTVICGGDTTGFVEELMTENPDLNYTLISTGGGATLEYILNHNLPGLGAIEI